MLYTAQYRYSGPDRLDISVKGMDPVGRVLAPTWDMVNRYKKDPVNYQKTYTELYFNLLNERFNAQGQLHALMVQIIRRANEEDVTLVCFCPAGAFCHRVLAARWIDYNFEIRYEGERR